VVVRMEPRTVGVEEELLLVDPGTRQVAPRSDHVLAQLTDDDPRPEAEELDHELFRHQLETRTPPMTGLDELREHLVSTRRLAAEAADRAGLAVVASGTIPVDSGEARVTQDDRYLDMVERYGAVARPAGTCGMHVHVHVGSDEEGVAVLDRIAPWLPVVLAVTANSPYHRSSDTGYASYRSQLWTRWPSAGPTERFGSVEGYREVCRRLVASGAARDPAMLYFDARLSEEHPTVEVRVADVCTDVDDAVLVAGLLRALVQRVVREGDPVPTPWRAELLRAAHWRAARYGLADDLLDPVTGERARSREVLEALVSLVREDLEETGDLGLVRDGVERVLAGTGAARQRAALERSQGSFEAVVDDLVTRTLP
jgi:carboxylate-amine ligase